MRYSPKSIDVFLLGGGFGRRLKKISGGLPKPMVKVVSKPFLDIIISYLAGFGFRNFIIGTGYKADIVESYYRNRKIPGLSVLFSREKRPLDTGGAVKNAVGLIRSNPFLVLNGDSFCKFNPLDFLRFHRQKKALISILLKKITDAGEYGAIRIDRNSRLLEFTEKNKFAGSSFVNAGVYLMDKEAIKLFPLKRKFSLEREFFPRMTSKRVYGYKKSGFFVDIGTPERLKSARRILR